MLCDPGSVGAAERLPQGKWTESRSADSFLPINLCTN